jgi:hypothetical protein
VSEQLAVEDRVRHKASGEIGIVVGVPYGREAWYVVVASGFGRQHEVARNALTLASEPLAVMPLPRCDMCRWWQQSWGPGGLAVSPLDHGECVLARDEQRRASEGDPGVASGAYGKADGMAVEGAGLTTRYDFGCTQWEGRGDG